ncbi:hypothetical protein HY440_00390 [Candidatus Microgenomates bacterium]|nr:hypothetical protein [Candidatus Microgenomates bacterium]
MRSRGASVADIAVLVVAANDSVMPQTVESIKIIKEAKIPYLVAINKVDLPEANVDKVISDLGRHEVALEGYGGDVPYVKISAKKSEGVRELLDLIRLLADISDVKGDEKGNLEAIVIESRMDKNRGPLATVVVKNGVLSVGQEIYVDGVKSKVRALIDYKNSQFSEASPGSPAEILGLTLVPQVGAKLSLSPNVVVAAQLAAQKSVQESGQSLALILKADTFGSLEAITALIPTNVNVVSSGVGEISEADILLARSTRAIVLGFNVKVASPATKLAEIEKVLVRTYKIIYELLDELKDAAAGMLTQIETEEVLGKGVIVAEFPFEKSRICGTKVTEGRIARGDMVKIGEAKSKIKSVRIGKEETNKVEVGKECGIFLDPQIDFKVGDDIIAYRII